MLIGLLMILVPGAVFVLTLPLSRYLRPAVRKAYRIIGGLIVFLGGTLIITRHFELDPAYQGNQRS